jgi:hypothetical protein
LVTDLGELQGLPVQGYEGHVKSSYTERCTDKETANLLRIYGRYDLEIAIVVAPQDRCLITDEFLVDMKHSMRARTRLSPVIYLDGDEPRSVRAYAELLAIYAVDDPPY